MFSSRDQLCDERPLQDMHVYIYMNIGYKPKIGMMLEKGFYLSIYGGYERILKSHTTDTSGLDQPYP